MIPTLLELKKIICEVDSEHQGAEPCHVCNVYEQDCICEKTAKAILERLNK